MSGVGQFERFTLSKLSDRNEFVKETFAGIAAAAATRRFRCFA
jgi:hypothetical protein